MMAYVDPPLFLLHDCMHIILGYLPFHELVNISKVCKYFRDFRYSPHVWRQFFSVNTRIFITDLDLRIIKLTSNPNDGIINVYNRNTQKRISAYTQNRISVADMMDTS
jgi:hypothetical protein